MASPYRLAMIEAITALGIKKAFAEMLFAAGLMKEDMAGNVILNYNCGGVTKIVQTQEVK